jgi:predicted ABC-type ATPase
VLSEHLNRRPIVIAVAGPNGAGKTTFFEAFLSRTGLPFVNADRIAKSIALDPYDAARIANELRGQLAARRESFVFETVLSDPVGEKVNSLARLADSGYSVVLCFVGVDSVETSDQRVAMRVSQGGHDVPLEKLAARFPRTLANLRRAIHQLPSVLVYDNSDLRSPYRLAGEFSRGATIFLAKRVPAWLKSAL